MNAYVTTASTTTHDESGHVTLAHRPIVAPNSYVSHVELHTEARLHAGQYTQTPQPDKA